MNATLQDRWLPSTLDALGRASALDAAVKPIRRAVRSLPDPVKEVLRGRWLGHAAHPTLVQVPVGAFLAATLADAWGDTRAARRLTVLGLAGAGPAAVAGWVDWAELHDEQARMGLVHVAATNSGVLSYAASLAVGRHSRFGALVLRLTGLSLIGIGGLIGGHLAYRRAAAANHAEQVPYLVPEGWQSLGPAEGYHRGETVRRRVGEVPVIVSRDPDGDFHVLAEQCSHLCGPLAQGEVTDGHVRCPWHGSVFRLSDGAVLGGPATAPQPVFETRAQDGLIEVRLPQM